MKVKIIRKVKGDEHDGHVERSKHQGLRNVVEQQGILGKHVWPSVDTRYKPEDSPKNEETNMKFTTEELQQIVKEELEAVIGEKKCKKAKGKRYVKRVDGKCRSFGQAGKAKGGGPRIRPGTKKGDAYCARSAKIKKCKNPPCANALSRKKWKCRGSKSMKE